MVGLGLCCCDHAHHVGKSLAMEVPVLRQREGLVAVRLGAEKRADVVEDAAEACSRSKRFAPSGGSVALFDAPMVLLQPVVY